MAIGFQSAVASLDQKLTIDFYYAHTHVFTINHKEYKKHFDWEEEEADDSEREAALPEMENVPKFRRPQSNDYIVFESTFDLKEYDSLNGGAAYIRPSILAIQDVVCFLTGSAIIPASFHSQYSRLTNKHIDAANQKGKLVFEGKSYSKDLNQLLRILRDADEGKRILILSVLDRWRKAVYMVEENEESEMFYDEAILTFFHIWEILALDAGSELEEQVRLKYKNVVEDILAKDLKYRPEKKKEEARRLENYFSEAFISRISIKTKILFLFEKLGMRTIKSEAMADRYHAFRNDIAHGKSNLYEDKAIYPLKPFFTHVKDIDENMESIMIGSAQVIAGYLGMKTWSEAWHYILIKEPMPIVEVKAFIVNKVYEKYQREDWFALSTDTVTMYSVTYHYVRKKISKEDYEKALKEFVMSVRVDEDSGRFIIYEAILLSDSSNRLLAEKCQGIIRACESFQWARGNLFRDILKELEYKGIKLQWFEGYLIERSRR